MAAPTWLLPSRHRPRGRTAYEEDIYKLDPDKSPKHNACDILRGLCSRSGVFYDVSSSKANAGSPTVTEEVPLSKSLTKTIVSDGKRLSYLNALVKLLSRDEMKQKLGFSTEELLCCLRVSLVHEATQVRAGTLRAVRYVLRTEADIVAFNTLRLPYLVTRSLDVVLRNEMERVQALRVVRRAIRLGANRCEPAIARALVAVPSASSDDKDRMMRAYLAALCELGVLNPFLFIQTGGVSALTRAILDCQTPRIAESLCGILLYLLNDPKTRLPAKVDLRCLAAPYCDFHYRHGWMDKNRDEREMRFTCSRLSLLSILRSWPGLLHFCDPQNESGLRAIVDVLYLNQLEVRKAILDLLYELLGLPQPEWTDELTVALAAVDPSDFQDSWRLNEGFVAAEGRAILPHLSATGPNLTELHLALLLYCFLEVGLLDALVEVMVTSDTFISVRATVLLGQLLHLVHLLLPPETCNISPALPSLLSRASAMHPQALAAVAALQNLNSLLKSRPASNSLFLDHVLQCCDPAHELVTNPEENVPTVLLPKTKSDLTHKTFYKETLDLLNDDDYEMEHAQRRSFGTRSELSKKNEAGLVKSKSVSARTSAVVNKVVKTKKIFNIFENLKDSDNLIKDSNVLSDKAGTKWDWNIIRAIIKSGSLSVEKQIFVERLVNYFKPSSNRFSHTDLQQNPLQTRDQTLAALDLVSYLLILQEPPTIRLLTLLFTDIRSQIAAITLARSAHECLFSPQHMANTMCQMYFLFIGRLCSTRDGLRIFKDTGLFESLICLSTSTHHTCYVKLIISSLDYTINSYPRQILTQTLQCNLEASRLYATQFLNVLLRARQKAGEINNKQSNSLLKSTNSEKEFSSSQSDLSGNWTPLAQSDECHEMDAWILELLCKQARDESKAVSLCALNILDEACNVPIYLNKLVNMKPHVKDLGDKGYLLWVRFASTPIGFQTLADAGYVNRQIRYWAKQYNYRYTRLVEGDIHDCLTLLQRSEDGRYSRRHSSAKSVSYRGAPLLPHLYAQLVLHREGINMLAQNADLPQLLEIIKLGHCSTEQEIMDLKAALWACGHVATSSAGIELLLSSIPITQSVVADTIKLATTCQVYSIRGTAFYVLGLMGCSYDGANVLYELGWLCVRHNRHERWPLIQEENWLTKSESENQIFQNCYQQQSKTDKRIVIDTETSENSDKTDQSNAESSHSADNIKFTYDKITATGLGIDHSLTEESCESCDGDIVIEKLENQKPKVRSISECSDKPERRIKCQTLPQRFYPSSRKHQRSLSESKTVDKFKSDDDGNETTIEKFSNISTISENQPIGGRLYTIDVWHEGLRRNRNNSESSTSGVSSCDSVLGKYVINDRERIPTLSPIPSSSSLSAMKNSIPNRKQSGTNRRISLHSYTGSDITSSPPSQRDLFGYATMRSLSRHRRPTYADASVDEISSFIGNEIRRPLFASSKGKNKVIEARNSQLSVLKHDWEPIGGVPDCGRLSRGYCWSEQEKNMNNMANIKYIADIKAGFLPSTIPLGPCYVGISMPRCLLDIFPKKNMYTMEESSEANYLTGDDSLAIDFENSFYQDAATKKNDDSNFNSSFSDLSVGNDAKSSSRIGRAKSRDRFTKHDQLSCLYCSRLKPAAEVRKTSDLREAFFAGMDSPKPSGSSAKSGVIGKSPAPTNSLTYASLDVSCESPTSLDSNLSKLSDGNPNVVGEILKHSERMGNPVWHKQSKQTLLGLKQKYPDAFQSVCLYSEICKIVSRSTYRLNARRFLQELFLDLNFDIFYLEPQQIIQNKYAELETSSE